MNVEPHNKRFYQLITAEYLTLEQYQHIDSLSTNESLLDKIVRTGVLQVGYNPESIPFSFLNNEGVLVGFDIDFVYDLAEQLHCNKIEFYPVYNDLQFQECLDKGVDLNIGVGGNLFRGDVAGKVITSAPYISYTPAIVIPGKDKKKYSSFEDILEDKNITLSRKKSCFKHFLKNKHLIELDTLEEYYVGRKSYALLTSGEIASAISIFFHGYWVYFYTAQDIRFYYAFYLNSDKRADTFRNFVDNWIDISFKNGTLENRYNYWIMGELEERYDSGWSILGWLKKNNYFYSPKKTQDSKDSREN